MASSFLIRKTIDRNLRFDSLGMNYAPIEGGPPPVRQLIKMHHPPRRKCSQLACYVLWNRPSYISYTTFGHKMKLTAKFSMLKLVLGLNHKLFCESWFLFSVRVNVTCHRMIMSSKNFSDGSNTILSNIEERTRTSFYEHRTNSNVFIYWWSKLEHQTNRHRTWNLKGLHSIY